MPREAEVNRLYNETVEKQQREAQQAGAYPNQLMNLLERAQRVGFDLKVRNGCFIFNNLVGHSKDPIELAPVFSKKSLANLERMAEIVQQREEELNEQQRRLAVKAAALAKLTAEERELLGL